MSVGGVVLHMPCSFHSEIRELVPTLVIPCHLWTVVLYSPSRPLFGPLECKRFNCLFCPKIVDTRVNISTVHQNGLQFIFELLVNWKDCWSAVCVVHHLRAKTPLSSIIICEYSFLNISSVEVIAQGGVVNALKANSQKRKKKKAQKTREGNFLQEQRSDFSWNVHLQAEKLHRLRFQMVYRCILRTRCRD